jgi:hypothetical protein
MKSQKASDKLLRIISSDIPFMTNAPWQDIQISYTCLTLDILQTSEQVMLTFGWINYKWINESLVPKNKWFQHKNWICPYMVRASCFHNHSLKWQFSLLIAIHISVQHPYSTIKVKHMLHILIDHFGSTILLFWNAWEKWVSGNDVAI